MTKGYRSRASYRAGVGLLAGSLLATAFTGATQLDAQSAAAAEAQNLLANASFEEGATTLELTAWSPLWIGSDKFFTVIGDPVSHGEQSLRILDENDAGATGLVSDEVPVEAEQSYEFSYDQFRTSGHLLLMTYFFDEEGTQISRPYESERSTIGQWERSVSEFTAPAGAVSAKVMFYSAGAGLVDTVVDNAFFGLATEAPEEPELSPVDKILVQDERIDYLGTPVTSQIPSQAAQGIEDGRHVSYQAFKGNPTSGYPATFVVTDVASGTQLRTCTIDGADHARNLNIADDGRVYWGTYHDSKLWRYDPATGECTDLGRISDVKDSTFGVSPGSDGSMYIGSYPDARLFHVDPVTDEVELLRKIGEGIDYIHAIAYHAPTDTLYVGSGGRVPQIWKITEGGRGEQTLIADETTVPRLNEGTQFVGRMDIVGDRIIAQVGLRMLVLDLNGNVVHWDPDQTRFLFGHHVIQGATADTAIFSTDGGELLAYDIPANTFSSTGIDIGGYLSNGVVDTSGGTPLLYGTSSKAVFVANLETGELVSNEPIEFAQPTLIQKLFPGPDGGVWASGYMVGLAEVDKTGVSHGPTMQRGQFESAAVRDGKMYFGGYGHARFDVLDPATYDPADAGTVPTLFDGVAQGQDRPFGMAYNPDRDEIYMGSVATYGQTQGALAIWDAATGEHEWLTTEIGEDENIISVAYNPTDGLVYLGSTVDGGLGSVPSGHTAGKLIVFDPATRTVVKTIDPIGEEREGVGGLMVDPDGVVWGVAEEALFAYDPTTGESTVEATVGGRYSAGTTYWAYGTVNRSNADGRIYVTAGYRFSVHDPATGETTRIANGLQWSAVDGEGDVYVSAGANLFRYDVEDVEWASCTEKPAADIADGLVVRSDEVVCIDGIRVDEGVMVEAGGALLMRDTDVRGGIQADGAARIEVRSTEVRGAVAVRATTGAFVFAGNEVRGSMTCADNAVILSDEGSANTVSGAISGCGEQ